MADCSDNVKKRGTTNPIQSKIVENDHGSGSSGTEDNVIEGVTCDSTVAVGNIVRMNGATAVNALANNTTNSKAIGICVAKASSTECSIQVTGFTSSIFGGLTPSQNYFLSETTPGAITTTAPTGSGEIVLHVGRAYTASRIVIQIGPQIRRN
jgi:hypothetical protein